MSKQQFIEGIVVLIWAAADMTFFDGGVSGLSETILAGGAGLVVNKISLGPFVLLEEYWQFWE